MYCLIVGTVNCVGFNDEGTVVLSGSIDSTVRAWDYRSRKNDPIQVCIDLETSMSVFQGNSIVMAICCLNK